MGHTEEPSQLSAWKSHYILHQVSQLEKFVLYVKQKLSTLGTERGVSLK